MKLTRNIWRVNNDMKIKEEKQRHSRFRFGAIIEYENTILFVDLEDNEDEERFNKFIEENDMEDTWVIEDTLPSNFCVEDYDTETYSYHFKDSMAVFQPEQVISNE